MLEIEGASQSGNVMGDSITLSRGEDNVGSLICALIGGEKRSLCMTRCDRGNESSHSIHINRKSPRRIWVEMSHKAITAGKGPGGVDDLGKISSSHGLGFVLVLRVQIQVDDR